MREGSADVNNTLWPTLCPALFPGFWILGCQLSIQFCGQLLLAYSCRTKLHHFNYCQWRINRRGAVRVAECSKRTFPNLGYGSSLLAIGGDSVRGLGGTRSAH